jgi:hypothetical protein
MRVSTRLPFEWLLFDRVEEPAELQQRFALPSGSSVAAALKELGDAVNHALDNIADIHIRHAINTLNKKIDLLQPLHAQKPQLPGESVVLSHEGMHLTVAQPVQNQQLIAIHLILDDGYSFLECGTVTRCSTAGDRYELGITFNDLSDSNAKRLARQVMRTKPAKTHCG